MTDFIASWLEERQRSGERKEVLGILATILKAEPLDEAELVRQLKVLASRNAEAVNVGH